MAVREHVPTGGTRDQWRIKRQGHILGEPHVWRAKVADFLHTVNVLIVALRVRSMATAAVMSILDEELKVTNGVSLTKRRFLL